MIELINPIYNGQDCYRYHVKTDCKTLKDLVTDLKNLNNHFDFHDIITLYDRDGVSINKYNISDNIPNEYLDAKLFGVMFVDWYGYMVRIFV